ncbi:unnamed protein product [Paramecium primaurelia]|uniref:Uncharacterized protein n=1 Tax=Paramecium primaurelia TaxID=5886 RepID=A0A8S1PM99_PARPR|nr:unnamed protein product [Paramecium primaurelia]
MNSVMLLLQSRQLSRSCWMQQGNYKKPNQIQFLSEHTREVKTVNFMKNTNKFVSGSQDSLIIIWQLIGNNQRQCQQQKIDWT